MPEINTHMYCQMFFDKGAKIIACGKKVFSTNGSGNTRNPQAKESRTII